MPVKRIRPYVNATIDPVVEKSLKRAAGKKRGRVSEIVEAALRAYLGLPHAAEKIAA